MNGILLSSLHSLKGEAMYPFCSPLRETFENIFLLCLLLTCTYPNILCHFLFSVQFFEGVLTIQPSKNQEMHAFPYACFELGSLMLEDEAVSSTIRSNTI